MWDDVHIRLPLQLAPHLTMKGVDASTTYTAIDQMSEKREIIVQPCVVRPFYQISLASPPLPGGGQTAGLPSPAAGALTTTPSRGGGGNSRGGGTSGGGGPSFGRGGGGGAHSTPLPLCKFGAECRNQHLGKCHSYHPPPTSTPGPTGATRPSSGGGRSGAPPRPPSAAATRGWALQK